MKQRWISLALTLTLLLSVCAVSAAAEEDPVEAEQPEEAAEAVDSTDEADPSEPESESEAEAEDAAGSPAGPDTEDADAQWSSSLDEKTQRMLDKTVLQPEQLDTVSFSELEPRMREHNLQLMAIEENVLLIEEMDYDKLYEDLRLQLNEIASTQWSIVTLPDAYMSAYEKDKSYEQLKQAYDGLRETFDAIKDGDLQKDNADAVWQLNSLEDQLVMGGESLYAALIGLEIQESGLERQLNALNRTVEEMELRYNLGQISALQLTQTKAGQTSLSSGLETLRMNISTYKAQLELFLGAEQTGRIALSALPEVTARELDSMNLEEDLQTAKNNSYALYEAALTLRESWDDYIGAGGDYASRPERLEYQKVKRAWNNAQYTYNNTLQDFELKFRTLYAQVQDCRQILSSAQVSLASEQQSFQASELKYQQGTISQNAYLDAKDALAAAEDTVKTAANDLFSTYNTYCWAVQHGILN